MFVFNGNPMCFIHVLLNASDMNDRGHTAKIVIEGEATKLIPELNKPENRLNRLWESAKSNNLIDGVCKACANNMETLKDAKEQGLPILNEMSGHPSMGRYIDEGWEIFIF